MSIEFQGADKVFAYLKGVSDLDGMDDAVKKACAVIERAAIKKAPKDTGALRRSIQSKVEKNGDEIVGIVFTPLEYAPYVEYGTGAYSEKTGRSTPWAYKDDDGKWHTTKGMQPQPFMRPALQENKDKIAKILEEGIK